VSEKKEATPPQYSTHNFDKFSHSFVIFGTNHPDTSMY